MEEQKVLIVEDGASGLIVIDEESKDYQESISEVLRGEPIMDMEYMLPEEMAKRDAIENKLEPTFEEKVFDDLLPESGMIDDFVFGPNHRKELEGYDYYKMRLKIEKKVLQIRERNGLNIWDAKDKGQFTNPDKQAAKKLAKIKKQNRIKISRAKRKEMGLL